MEEEKKRVFVLDDDEGMLIATKRMLEQAGFDVRVSNHAIGASKDISKYYPHIVLLDVMMPALKGTKIVGIIRKNMDPAPVIILYSNKASDELRELAIESGADDYLCKTEGPSGLLRKIRMHTL